MDITVLNYTLIKTIFVFEASYEMAWEKFIELNNWSVS